MKLPFAIFGVLSVYLTYLIGKKWFNATVGLISASLIATIQYTVMYSVIARPYSSGMFLCLLAVLFWTNVVKSPDKKFYLNAILYVVTSAMCAYNHHFTLMFAFVLGVTGVFFIPKKLIWKYIICGVLIFLLYTPHLSIFQMQLSQGGIGGWLAKPKNDFIIDYLFYIFHFSYLFVGVVIAIIIAGFFMKGETKERNKHFAKSLLFLSLFTIPFLISFFYSKYINAVIQFSVLIFGFPFLLIFLFGHFKELKAKWNLIIVVIIMGVSIFTLVVDRQHYDLFYGSANRDVLVNHDKFKSDQTLSFGNIYKKTAHYNGALLNIDSNILKFDFESPKALKSYLENEHEKFDRVYYGFQVRKKLWAIPIIQSYFPKLVWYEYYQDGSAYLFEKGASSVNYLYQFDFESDKSLELTGLLNENIQDSIGENLGKCYHLDTETNHSPIYSKNIGLIELQPYKFIDVSVNIFSKETISKGSIDCWIELDGQNIDWSSSSFDQLFDSKRHQGEWTQVLHSFPLRKEYGDGKLVLKVRITNAQNENFFIDDFDISIREENPYIYKLYKKI
jgi:hypothetical protein